MLTVPATRLFRLLSILSRFLSFLLLKPEKDRLTSG